MTLVRPRILVLDEVVPVPMNTGKRIRTWNLLTRLARSFRIDLLVHATGVTEASLSTLRAAGLTVHVASSQVPRQTGPRFYYRVLASLLSPFPYSVFSHQHRAYRERLHSLLDTNAYDLVHCEWTPYAIYRTRSRVPWVVSAHNIESEVWDRLAESHDRAPMRAFLRIQAGRMARFEKGVFSTVPAATAVSERDARRITSWGCPRVAVVPNGVDLSTYPLMDPDQAEPRHLVFVGSMDWRPNQDGVRWFLDQVHPLLESVPGYKLTVVGRNPPPSLVHRGTISSNTVVTGEVPDVRPHLERSSVVIVPLRVGGGSRLKILEAFACGKPVVSTTVGAEGLEVEDGRHIVLADTPEAFAQAVRSLFLDRARAREITSAARDLVESKYAWGPIADLQGGVWTEAMEGR